MIYHTICQPKNGEIQLQLMPGITYLVNIEVCGVTVKPTVIRLFGEK